MGDNIFSDVYISFMSEEIIYSNLESKPACWCCKDTAYIGSTNSCDQTGYPITGGGIGTFQEYCISEGGTITVAVDFPC